MLRSSSSGGCPTDQDTGGRATGDVAPDREVYSGGTPYGADTGPDIDGSEPSRHSRPRVRKQFTELMAAAQAGELTQVHALIQRDATLQTTNGLTALMFAAQGGHLECVRALAPLEAELQDGEGATGLVHALRSGHFDIAALLLEYGGRPRWFGKLMCAALQRSDADDALVDKEAGRTTPWGHTALMLAASSGNVQLVHALSKKEGGHIDDQGCTALMLAARQGHASCVKELVAQEQGLQDRRGRTALIHAARMGHSTCVALLEGEVRIHDSNGLTALMYATLNGHSEVVRALADAEINACDGAGHTALMIAARRNDIVCGRLLLGELGRQTVENAMYVKGSTALLIAASTGSIDMVRLLKPYELHLTNSAGVTARDIADLTDNDEIAAELACQTTQSPRRMIDLGPDYTTLMCAAVTGDIELLRMHLHEAKVRDRHRRTALMHAAIHGHLACVEALLPLEARLQDKDGTTALIYAVGCDAPECVRVLATKEIGIRDKKGRTALMCAVNGNRVDCAQLLLGEARTRTMAKWYSLAPGSTALMIAATAGCATSVALLAPYEAGLFNTANECAFTIALRRGHQDCVQLLIGEALIANDRGEPTLMLIQRQCHSNPSVRSMYCRLQPSLKADMRWHLEGRVAYVCRGPRLFGRVQSILNYADRLLDTFEAATATYAEVLLDEVFSTILGERLAVPTDALAALDSVLDASPLTRDRNTWLCEACGCREQDAVCTPCHHNSLCTLCADATERRCRRCCRRITGTIALQF
ncbi:Ankyrin repeat protein 1 [Giardia muris]|uniref:Ankyrin repeat protein 1 n=1 Tax=Giardia muris TaxID=5742 RepID=A0A4Z1SRS8_GIAMU|nr:Ankyrin repeat protein 1 [Giardia muris]|eukprot:TNJ28586.1 Ankyrin repeat protein 1 [Giardia muris]